MSKMEATPKGTTTFSKEIKEDTNIPILNTDFDDDFPKEVELSGDFYRVEENISVFKETLDNLQFKPDLLFIFAGLDGHKDDLGDHVAGWDNRDRSTDTERPFRIDGSVLIDDLFT